MKTLKIIALFLTFAGLSSCNDFLSEIPDNRTQIDTPEKISELLVNAYPTASYMEFSETMTDNVFDSGFTRSNIKNGIDYNWGIHTEIGDDTPSFYWDACYNAIAHANQALASIKELGNPSSLNPQKGEALLARAYAHHMLVILWGKSYNITTSKTDLGIPYVTEPETQLKNNYKRNTVAEVYDFIEKDIEEGLKYINNRDKHNKFHFNIEAAKAFASRFYLIEGNWKRVIELSNDLVNSADIQSQLRNYFVHNTLDFRAQLNEYASQELNTNLLISSCFSQTLSNIGFGNRYGLTDVDGDLLFNRTTNLFGKSWVYNRTGLVGGGNLSIVTKFGSYFKLTNVNAGIGFNFHAFVFLSNDEFLLNRIEALVMMSQYDEAIAYLEFFIATRTANYNPATDILTEQMITDKYPVVPNEYTPYYALSPLQSSYIKAIAEVRRREFIHEGLRWMDIKRFGLKVTHGHLNQVPIVLSKDDVRKQLQIPNYAIDNGIEKNQR
jgi:Starch-binding associating with outer membrane/SusD family